MQLFVQKAQRPGGPALFASDPCKSVQVTKVSMSLDFDSGIIRFRDAADSTVFYIEDALDDEADLSELSGHFFRQHLIKNGMLSIEATRQMRSWSGQTEAMIAAAMGMHLAVLDNVEEALRVTRSIIGLLLSMLEQREKARERVREVMAATSNIILQTEDEDYFM
jgi:hypothetical protein